VHSSDKVKEVFALRRAGLIQREVASKTGVSLGQVRKWLTAGEDVVLAGPMRLAASVHSAGSCSLIEDLPVRSYAYLLGQYPGDGCLVAMKRGVLKLVITTCDDYPGIRNEVRRAIEAVMPGRVVNGAAKQGCVDLYCYSKHWPCLFPQHGPGRKHKRKIELAPWQHELAMRQAPDDFVRGLIHSDGCRAINRVVVRGKRYEYVRYFFSNRSRDIRLLFLEACGSLGIEARHSNAFTVSVARRHSVALLEEIVGPKR